MQFKGTKRKWEIEYICDNNSIRASVNKGSIDVWTNMNGETIEETNANALLISKAPELLEKLSVLLSMYTNTDKPSTRLILETQQLIKEATEL